MDHTRDNMKYSEDELKIIDGILSRLFRRGIPVYLNQDLHLSEINQRLDQISSRLSEIEKCCHSVSDHAQLLVNQGSWQSGRGVAARHLSEFASSSDELIIIDPYFFSTGGDASEYAGKINEALGIEGTKLKRIHIIFDKAGNQDVRQAFEKKLNSLLIDYSYRQTDLFHDRIWISDRSQAIFLGTSLNGVGGDRLSFILDLPSKDLQGLLLFLHNNSLLPLNNKRSERSKSMR